MRYKRVSDFVDVARAHGLMVYNVQAMDISVSSSGVLSWSRKEFRCAIGRNGVTSEKIEGDGATPVGCFVIREVLYRPDKLPQLVTDIPISTIKENDGWCDDPDDAHYNKRVALPYPASHERLWRDDNLYDVVAVLGYNDKPVVPDKGSAIFMHVAAKNYAPTEGCIALALSDLVRILKEVSLNTKVCIHI